MDVSKRTKEVLTAVQEITETEPKSRQNQLRDSEMYQTLEIASFVLCWLYFAADLFF